MFFMDPLDPVTKYLWKKVIWNCSLLCKGPGCYQRVIKTSVTESIFKLTPIHASVIFEISRIQWFQWILLPFMENSNEPENGHWAGALRCPIMRPNMVRMSRSCSMAIVVYFGILRNHPGHSVPFWHTPTNYLFGTGRIQFKVLTTLSLQFEGF